MHFSFPYARARDIKWPRRPASALTISDEAFAGWNFGRVRFPFIIDRNEKQAESVIKIIILFRHFLDNSDFLTHLFT